MKAIVRLESAEEIQDFISYLGMKKTSFCPECDSGVEAAAPAAEEPAPAPEKPKKSHKAKAKPAPADDTPPAGSGGPTPAPQEYPATTGHTRDDVKTILMALRDAANAAEERTGNAVIKSLLTAFNCESIAQITELDAVYMAAADKLATYEGVGGDGGTV